MIKTITNNDNQPALEAFIPNSWAEYMNLLLHPTWW